MYTETSSCTPANGCPQNQGSLPGGCGALAFPFVAMQQQDPPRYDQREALQQGTLFPGLDLPFHKELRSRFPAANNALSELMALLTDIGREASEMFHSEATAFFDAFATV